MKIRELIFALLVIASPLIIIAHIIYAQIIHVPLYKKGEYVTFGQAKRCSQIINNGLNGYYVRFPNGRSGVLLESEIKPCPTKYKYL